MRRDTVFTVLFILLLAIGVFAGTTGKITGIVTDVRNGEPLIGVNVFIDGTNLGATTDLDGNYVILNVPPGRYTLTVQYIGYQEQKVSNVAVSIDLTSRQDFQLGEQTLELDEAIVVEGTRPLLQKDITSSQSMVSSEEIDALPVTEVTDVLQLQAGVTRDAGGGFHIRGGRSNEIAYWVNGVAVTDVYDNSSGITVDNSSIQELQVISGTFNAEYGNAMSGIVNIVTKEGSPDYHGSLNIYADDYVSTHDDIFFNVGDYSPVANYNVQGSLSGPLPFTNNKVTFFANARYNYDDGFLYGRRVFLPTGEYAKANVDESMITKPEDYWGEAFREQFDIVAMNWSKNYQGQAKLAWYVLPTFKVNLEGLYSKAEWQDYDHGLKLNPDGNVFKFSDSYNSVLTLTHTLSSRTFYTLNASYFYKEFNQYRYEDPYDPRHYFVPDSLLPEVNNLAFSTIGMNLGRFWRETETISAKMDFTSQINMSNLIKFGFEAKKHRLGVDGYSLQKLRVDGIEVVPFQPDVPDVSSPARNVFEREPFEFSAYAQDKIELDEVIINVGLRLDYFNSNADVLLDTSDPNINIPLRIDQGLDELSLDERRPYFYKKADPKWQVSPRLGIAYPISTTGVIHFSYGHFLQIPSFQYLYNNSDYKVPETGSGGVYGNPNLNPQRTVMYEIGLRQEFGNDYLVEVTGFYRDVRDWISTQQYLTKNGVLYALYENKDYSNVKGVTLTLKKRFSQSFAFDVNYTFQFAEGSNSSPEEEFYNSRSNNEPTLFLLPMDWDQRHLLNVSLMVGGEDWGSTILGRIGSGLPYTPQITQYTSDRGISSGLQKNSRSRPIQYTFDVNLYKMFRVADYDLKAFMKIFNLFDTKNVVNVFGDTGQPDYTTQYANVAEDVRRPNSIAEYTTYPWHYSAPRKVQVGVEWSF